MGNSHCVESKKVTEPAGLRPNLKESILQSDMVRKIATRDIKEDYKLLAVLGEGAFGEVKRAIHKITNIDRAVKIIKKGTLSKNAEEKIMKEVQLVREIDHPNALKIIECYDDPYCINIVFEAYTGGTLAKQWLKGVKFSEAKICEIMRDLLRVIVYMHSKGIVHRDIKPDNIMFATHDEDTIIKLIDFGEAIYFTKNQKILKTCGTLSFMAPEVLDGRYDEKCDIWALGVVLYMLLAGKMPFDAHTEEILIKKIKRAEISTQIKIFEKASEEAKDLIHKMLELNPDKRYSAKQCLSHPWFEKMAQEIQPDKNIDSKVMETIANFKGMTLLQNAFWAFAITYFSSYEDTIKIVRTWNALDKAGTGFLSKGDIKRGFDVVGMKNLDIDAIFKVLDFNKCGMIQYTEFLLASFEKTSFLTESKIESMFKMFDLDSDGFLTEEEFRNFLTPSEKVVKNPDYIDMMIEVHDKYKQKISLDEFTATVIQYFL